MYEGILPVFKPKGMTSHDVVFKLRKMLGMKKIGHTGTLDPEVDGVLVICLGKATKLVEFIMDGHKVYEGEITIGVSTETEDAHGPVVDQVPVSEHIEAKKIDKTMETMTGQIQQIPPYYSAVKVDGKRLYEYARAGIEVARPVRDVTIYNFERTSKVKNNDQDQTQSFEFKVECGKGTYVRTLAVDLGEELGYPAHMSNLRRLATGGFKLDQSLELSEIQTAIDEGNLEEVIQPLEMILNQIPSIEITDDQWKIIKNGQVVTNDFFTQKILDSTGVLYKGRLVAIYYPHPTKQDKLKPQKMFINNN